MASPALKALKPVASAGKRTAPKNKLACSDCGNPGSSASRAPRNWTTAVQVRLWEHNEIIDMLGHFSKAKTVTGVAQLVSALDTIIPEVAGSSPVTGPFQMCVFHGNSRPCRETQRVFKQVLSSARQSAGLQNQRSHVRSVQGLLTDYSILRTFASAFILFFLSSTYPAATAR